VTVLQLVADVSRRLRGLEIPHAIGGSLASSLWGDFRTTNDADLGIVLDPAKLEKFVQAFEDPYLVSRAEVEDALQQSSTYRTVQVLHMDEAFKFDLFLVRPDAYTDSEFSRIREVEVTPGLVLPYLAPENIALQKLRWYRVGNEVSDRQWNDIVRLIEVQGDLLDRAYLRQWASELGVLDLLEEALAEAKIY
jgi:hypothetical protein